MCKTAFNEQRVLVSLLFCFFLSFVSQLPLQCMIPTTRIQASHFHQLLLAPISFLFLEETWSAAFKNDSNTWNTSLAKNKLNFLCTFKLPVHYCCTQQWWAIPNPQTHLESCTLHWLCTAMGSCSLPDPASTQCTSTSAVWQLAQGRWGSSLLLVSELQLRHHFGVSGLFYDCELLLIPARSNIWTSKQVCGFSAFTWIEGQNNVIPAFRIMEPTYESNTVSMNRSGETTQQLQSALLWQKQDGLPASQGTISVTVLDHTVQWNHFWWHFMSKTCLEERFWKADFWALKCISGTDVMGWSQHQLQNHKNPYKLIFISRGNPNLVAGRAIISIPSILYTQRLDEITGSGCGCADR